MMTLSRNSVIAIAAFSLTCAVATYCYVKGTQSKTIEPAEDTSGGEEKSKN